MLLICLMMDLTINHSESLMMMMLMIIQMIMIMMVQPAIGWSDIYKKNNSLHTFRRLILTKSGILQAEIA